jgi:hypothetical protein
MGDKWCNKIIIASNINVWIHTSLVVETSFSFHLLEKQFLVVQTDRN